jgi:hypothetical protein
MPVFAMPFRWRDLLFREMRPLGRRSRSLGLAAAALGILAVSLPLFSFPSGTSERVSWSAIDVMAQIEGTSAKPLPKFQPWVEFGRWGIWDPFFLLALFSTYVLLAACAAGIAIPALRKLFLLVGPLVFLSAVSLAESVRWPFVGSEQARADVGVAVLVLVSCGLMVLPHIAKSLDE